MVMFKRHYDMSSNQWVDAELGAFFSSAAIKDNAYFDWVISDK